MPNIKSAKKRVLVNEKKYLENRMIISSVKTAIKKFNNAILNNDVETAEKLLPATMSAIDSAASKGILHKNNAANKKSAISTRLNNLKIAIANKPVEVAPVEVAPVEVAPVEEAPAKKKAVKKVKAEKVEKAKKAE